MGSLYIANSDLQKKYLCSIGQYDKKYPVKSSLKVDFQNKLSTLVAAQKELEKAKADPDYSVAVNLSKSLGDDDE